MRQSALYRNSFAPVQQASVKSRLQLQRLWDAIFNSFSFSPDPQIQEQRDSSGRPSWQVYDPQGDRTLRFSSESDLLVWLEDRPARSVGSNPWDQG